MASAPLIELRNIRLQRGNTEVFRDFNLRIDQQANTAILGPNGAGKSSLLKLILRDLYPMHDEHSSISILGNAYADVWSLRAHFGLVSHDLQHNFEPQATGLQVVMSGFESSIGTWQHQRYTTEQRDRALHVMANLDITGLVDHRYQSMSTGQQRRLLLARALVHDPEYLLLDEPTSGLDPKAAFDYMQLLRTLINNGHHLVLITHHLHEIPPEVDQVIMLKAGQVFAQGDKSALFTSEKISALYDTPLKLIDHAGFYQVFPTE